MVKHAPGAAKECCPHVDQNDPRCGHRFSIGRIDQAFNVCFGSFHGCPMFHRLNREADASMRSRAPEVAEDGPIPLISITTNGRALALRPTGS